MGRMVQEFILGRALPSSKANIGGVNGGKLHKYGTANLLNFELSKRRRRTMSRTVLKMKVEHFQRMSLPCFCEVNGLLIRIN